MDFFPLGPTKGIDFKGLGLEIGKEFLLSRVEKSCLEVDFFEQRKSTVWVPKVFSLCAGGCFDTFWAEAERTSVC